MADDKQYHRVFARGSATVAKSKLCDNRCAVPLPVVRPPIGVRLRQFRIFKVQDDGRLQFVEAVQAFDDAKERVQELGELWPGEYAIDNEETGERVFISTRNEMKN